MEIDWLQQQIKSGKYLWTFHADQERRNDGLEILAVENAILTGRILEQYPNDPRGASCLVLGMFKEIPIHIEGVKDEPLW